ncbi:hypothetical protein ACFVJ8_31275 [Streptomyces yangpuensis]|uniref:hypothetical protein n=1 Tax=Streptomyces yangpuensis TaxID=1648182 RepID=UPI0036265145
MGRPRGVEDEVILRATAPVRGRVGPTGLTAPGRSGARHPRAEAFLCTDLTDPQLYERAPAVHRARRRAIGELSAEAVDAGELRAGTDVAALAGAVQAITARAGLTWAVDRSGLAQRLRRELDAVLHPHLPPRRGHEPAKS